MFTEPCDWLWWLEQQKEPFFELLRELLRNSSSYLHQPRLEYFRLTMLVAANLLDMIDQFSPDSVKKFGNAPSLRSGICLLQLAIGGPNVIPADLQDRASAVRKILSLGYPPNLSVNPWYLYSNAEDDRFVKSTVLTPLAFLLSGRGNARYSEDARLSIAKILLESGAAVDGTIDLIDPTGNWGNPTPLITYCAQYEKAAIVRVLLKYAADTNKRDALGWQPIDYALLRQDREVLAAFNDFKYSNVSPDLDPSLNATPSIPASLILISTTILSSYGHPALSILLARHRHDGTLHINTAPFRAKRGGNEYEAANSHAYFEKLYTSIAQRSLLSSQSYIDMNQQQ